MQANGDIFAEPVTKKIKSEYVDSDNEIEVIPMDTQFSDPPPDQMFPDQGVSGLPGSRRLSPAEVLGQTIFFERPDHHTILFTTESVCELVCGQMAIRSVDACRSLLQQDQQQQVHHRRRDDLCQVVGSMTTGEPKGGFIALNSLCHLLEESICDLALTDLLCSFRPLQSSDEEVGEVVADQAVLQLGGAGVPFTVAGSRILLSQPAVRAALAVKDPAFTLQLNQDSSNNTLEKQDGFVEVDKLVVQLAGSRLEEELNRLLARLYKVLANRDKLLLELDLFAEILPRQETNEEPLRPSSRPSGDQCGGGSHQRTYRECRNLNCNKNYHFTIDCCRREHVLTLGEHSVPAFYLSGRWFLEKCAAFGALGKLHMVRGSSYRAVDRRLLAHGLLPAHHFGPDADEMDTEAGSVNVARKRRNHISLKALTVLVMEGFVSPGKKAKYLDQLTDFALRNQAGCVEPDISSQKILEISDSDEPETTDNNVLSSSGVESDGEETDTAANTVTCTCSSAGATGCGAMKNHRRKTAKAPVLTVTFLGESLPYRLVGSTLFLHKMPAYRLMGLLRGDNAASKRLNQAVSRLVANADMEKNEAYLFESSICSFVSTAVLRLVVNSALMEAGAVGLRGEGGEGEDPASVLAERRQQLLSEISRIEDCVDNLVTVRTLELRSFGTIRYQLFRNENYCKDSQSNDNCIGNVSIRGHACCDSSCVKSGSGSSDDSSTGEKRIKAGKNSHEAGENRIEAGENRIEAGENRIEAGENSLEACENSLETNENRIEAGENSIKADENRQKSAKNSNGVGENSISASKNSLNAGKNSYEADENSHQVGENIHEVDDNRHEAVEKGHDCNGKSSDKDIQENGNEMDCDDTSSNSRIGGNMWNINSSSNGCSGNKGCGILGSDGAVVIKSSRNVANSRCDDSGDSNSNNNGNSFSSANSFDEGAHSSCGNKSSSSRGISDNIGCGKGGPVGHVMEKSCGCDDNNSSGWSVYLDTIRLVRLAGLQPRLVHSCPNRVYDYVRKVLEDRGIVNCFLKYRNSKYAFLSLKAGLALLECSDGKEEGEEAGEEGCGRRERRVRLRRELLAACHSRKLIAPTAALANKENSSSQLWLRVSSDYPACRYKIKNGRLFLNRKNVFECIGLESLILGNKKGFAPINTILSDLGLDLSQVYLSSQQEVFAYLWLPAVLLLLNSQDAFLVALPHRHRFREELLATVEHTLCEMLGSSGSLLLDGHKIPYRSQGGRLFLEWSTVLGLSRLNGLADWVQDGALVQQTLASRGLDHHTFLPSGPDQLAFISLDCLLCLMAQDGDGGRGRDFYSLLNKDCLSAIAFLEPRLKSYMRMSWFRIMLVTRLCGDYTRSLRREGEEEEETIISREEEESGLEPDITSDEDPCYSSTVSSISLPEPRAACPPAAEPEVNPLAVGRMEAIRDDLIAVAGGEIGGTIGDWELMALEPWAHFSVRAGYGAGRKVSFVHSDIAAILRYDLLIKADSCQLMINDRCIDEDVVEKVIIRAEREGSLSLLYHLISLRPCFGSFSAELVETVGQALQSGFNLGQQVLIDPSFIGTSSNGRMYAGTVRSVDCRYLAQSRVADRCVACNKLDSLIINRSLLSAEAGGPLLAVQAGDVAAVLQGEGQNEQQHESGVSHQSVWKLDTTDERGCSFLCPQIQTFNTSLPHAFMGAAQATTIVYHRVEITDKLDLKVELCGRLISRAFPDFNKSKQLGPLLDSVAALRLCIGYPASCLVNQARFLLGHMGRLLPEVRRLFRHQTVDETFIYRSGEEEGKGTIRSTRCQVEAEEGSDMCAECRALQDPLEFCDKKYRLFH